MNTDISRENTHKLLVTNIDDVCGDVHETDSVTILNTTLRWADYFDDFGSFEMNQDFKRMINNIATGNDIDEINIIDENGIIVASNSPEFLGYEMKSADQSREFMVLIDNLEVKTFVQGLGVPRSLFTNPDMRRRTHRITG
ncbi:MAG: cell wall metabolism sensor histidine kinase WalK [Bacteroidaceae bacterium]|nr:cell wall metabolism sensor histidine kinase WalK [Bacteroidaceae bacterium]